MTMVHTSNKELAIARSFYTGESYCAARAALRSYPDSRENPIPHASTPDQIRFEAEVLASLAGEPGGAGWWPDAYPLLVKSASPLPRSLSLIVPHECLVLFCQRILPAIEVAVQGSIGVSLVRGSAIILLPGIPSAVWSSALAAAKARGDQSSRTLDPPLAPEWHPFASGLLRRIGLLTDEVNSTWLRSGVLTSPRRLLPAMLEQLLAVPRLGVDDANVGDPVAHFRILVPKKPDNRQPAIGRSGHTLVARNELIFEAVELFCDDPYDITVEYSGIFSDEFDSPETVWVSITPGTFEVQLIESADGIDFLRADLSANLVVAYYVSRETWAENLEGIELYEEPAPDDGEVRVVLHHVADLCFDIEIDYGNDSEEIIISSVYCSSVELL